MNNTTQAIVSHRSSFWSEFLGSVSCTFPCLVHNSAADRSSNGQSRHQLEVRSRSSTGVIPLNLPRSIHHNVDPADLHLAAWAMLLSRYLGTDEVCFGVVEESGPITSNPPAAASKLPLHYLACRVLLARERETSAAVFDCRASVRRGRPQACFSAAELTRGVGSSPDQPRFNTAVRLAGCAPVHSASGTGMINTPVDQADFELVLVLSKSGPSGPESCFLEYSSALLSESAAALVAANYQAIFSGLASAALDTLLNQLLVVSAEDQAQTWSWNQTCPGAVDGLVHDYFRQNALSRPDAPAICASDGFFTYRELDATSDILANFLVQAGVGPEVIVPLCFEKSAWATVSMLAVAKAGGAFTFLDSSYPMETLRDILQQVDPKFLLCSASTVAMWDGRLQAYEVSASALGALPQLRDAPESSASPSNLLYLIFTSGSTGKPKGVCIEHSSYLSSALDFARVTGIDSSSRVLQFASYSFDASVLENLTTLVCGGCVCIPDEACRGKGIAHLVNEFGVTWAFFTPSLAKSISPPTVPGLKTLLLAGEAPSKAEVETWAGKVRLMNGYGPSECCIASAAHPSLDTCTEAANIGWPVGGLLWVVDAADHDQLVPLGAVGELVIEGPHLGRGYLNDPDKTARAFVDAPRWTADFPPSRSRRVYLTGDIVRRNMDGSFLFIGRKDTQVKVRGMRVELGAVEQHLSADRLVRLASAISPAKGDRKSRLVAVLSLAGPNSQRSDGVLNGLVLRSGSERERVRRSIRDIRDRLGDKAPRHMVPTSWFVLETFPLMPSGKVDRAKVKEWVEGMDSKALGEYECLPDQDSKDEESGSGVEVHSPLVEAVRRAISLVLNLPLDSVSPRMSFIGHGGDSISALQLVSQLQAQNMTINAQYVLRCKSVTEIARRVEFGRKLAGAPRVDESCDVPFCLSPIQQLFFQWEPEGTRAGGDNRFNQSFQLRVKTPVSLELMATALKIVTGRHSMLRCQFSKSPTTSGGYEWQQMIPKEVDNSFHLSEHQVSNRDEIRNIILKSQCDIDMIRGPVFIVDLINGPHGQLLSMIAHHLVVDLVSWRTIMRELELVLHGAILPPQRSLSWHAWCRLQADHAKQHLPPRIAFPHYNSAATAPNLEFWGMSDRSNTYRDAARANIQLSAEATSLLMSPDCHQALGTEPADVFLAVIINSFARTFPDRKLPTIFRESHGREPWDECIDISSTVGWFTTIYPVQVDAGDGSLIDTLRRVKYARERILRKGSSYLASRFHHAEGAKAFGSSSPVMEVIFDFLGLYQQLERREALFERELWNNLDVGPEFHRPSLFEITVEIIQGELQLAFEYSRAMDRQADIVRWIRECERDLSCAASELHGVADKARCGDTVSDFPLLNMGYDGLDSLLTSILPQLGVSADNVEDVYDTSPMQTGLLLSQAKDGDLYWCSLVFRVEMASPFESLDAQRLGDAWRSLVQRHSSLRTIFVPDISNGDAFAQVVLKTADARIAKVRCSADELDVILKGKTSLPLQDSLPPHRLTICEVEDSRWYIRIDINHVSIDGASGEVLVRDLVALYAGRIQLPEAPAYRAIIRHVKGMDLDEGLRYWTSRLDGVEPCHLPLLDDGIAQDGSLQVVHVKSPISAHSLRQFCKSHNTTLPTVFKLAWSLVLGAYTGSHEVCFGYLVSGRDELGVGAKENAVGAFANILTCRSDLSNTLASVLHSIQEDSLSDLQHQYCSLAHVQRGVGSQQPLFNTLLNFQVHAPPDVANASSLALTAEYTYEPTEFGCVVDIALRGGLLEISLAYRTSLVCRAQAENIASTFEIALEATPQFPAAVPVKMLNLLSESNSKQIWGWNRTVPPRVEMCIHEVVSRHAAAHPTALAIESWDMVLTYERLCAMATQLARHLAHLGVRAGSIVPLCFERSAWTIVAMLAVLEANGAFILLDPKHYSAERTAGIIRATKAELLVVGGDKFIPLADAVAIHTVVVLNDNCMAKMGSCPGCHQHKQGSSHGRKPTANIAGFRDPAYLIFTSGTTGKPKGSITTHAALCTAAAGFGKRGGLSRSSRVLQYASYTFDACLAETLAVLLFGGCVCVPTEQQRTDGIAEFINKTLVNLAILTPSVARLITPTEVSALKTLVLAGEAVSPADIMRWKGHVRLVNAYGPSECSIACTLGDAVLNDPSNIGKPARCLCWAVDPDDHERLVPIGAVGELVVEGFTLANGYLDDEAKMAEVFIKPPGWVVGKRPNTSSPMPHRMYKTGDLIRFNSDGSIRFIGRKDTQSKLHGQRLELGEIEQRLLSRCSSIVAAVAVEVIKPEARNRGQALAAFFQFPAEKAQAWQHVPVLEQGYDNGSFLLDLPDDIAAQLQTLRDSLTAVLPSYMVPTLFIPVSAFPMTPSGKLNRNALLEVAARLPAGLLNRYSLAAAVTNQQMVLTSKIEEMLREAWVDILGSPMETVGRETNFFRRGGDSLNAMRLVSTVRSNYGLTLTVADVFKHPKLCDMAAVTKDSNRRGGDGAAPSTTGIEPFMLLERDKSAVSGLVSLAAAQCDVPQEHILDLYPCTPLQEGLMTLSLNKKGAYLGQIVFLLPETLDLNRLKRAWDVVVTANPILRTRIVSTETAGCLQAVLEESTSWLHPACSKEQYLADDLGLPLTWGAPLNRFAVLTKPDSGRAHLVWTTHHALFDAWSQGLIFEQLEKAYYGEALPNLVPFNRFIAHIVDSDKPACAAFWTDQLDGEPPATLPQQLPNGYVPRAETCHERIIDIAREAGSHITTPTILRAAWALVTGRYAAAEHVMFGASVSGRSTAVQGIDRINGPTMATVPVKVHLDRELPVSSFLEGIQAQATDMIAFEHWGLQNIAQVSKNAAFQNLLVVHLASENMGSTPAPLGLDMTSNTHADYHIYALIVECFLADNGSLKVRTTYDARVAPYAPQLSALFDLIIRQLIARADDDCPLGSLDFCSPEDKACIFGWNQQDPIIVEDCIHELVAKNARRRPEAAAVCSWDFNLTYAELDVMSTKLARHLAYLGVGLEKVVPAIFDKSAWAIVAQLAVLKAGGVMCMLDPSHPLQRLEDNIDTTDADLILSSESRALVLQRPGRTILPISAATMESITEAHCVASLPVVRPDGAAYVVFTSGTTGRPKASITEHRAFVSCSASFAVAMQISESVRALQHAAYSFDPFILETFSTLTQGGCVCLVKDEVRTDPAELAGAMCTLRVTWAMMTPSVGRLLPRDGVPSLKTLILCGEAMSQTDRSWSNTVRLINAYGPSECSVVSALNDNVTLESDNAAIGRGVGSRCWIVEPHDHNLLAPIGCVGELLLESPGLARGYLKEPTKTAMSFIHGPAWLQSIRPGSRMYKTSDLVRYSPANGMISFVGRKDTQVKIHGQRLELGEIEHHILAHDHVSMAVMTLPKAGKFKGKLVVTLSLRFMAAAAEIRDGSRVNPNLELVGSADKPTAARQLADVRAWLEGKVPSYMVPSVWAVVYGIPLTTSLKVDKREIARWLEAVSDKTALEIMELSNPDEETAGRGTTANVELERRLRDIVARVLGLSVDQVLLNRSFIRLGGDSITAIQVMARCRAKKIVVNTKDILQSKSIRQLAERAAAVASNTGAGDEAQHPQHDSESIGTDFGLSPIQKLYFDAGLGQIHAAPPSSTGSSHFNQSILVGPRRQVTAGELAAAVEAIVRQHSMLRARFTHNELDKVWTQSIRPAAREAFHLQHHTPTSWGEVHFIVAASQRRLDAADGVVFSVDSFDTALLPAAPIKGQHQQLLFMVAHHLVVDLVSWRIILQDLEEFLAAGKLVSREGALSFQAWTKMQERYVIQNSQDVERLADVFDVAPADCEYWGVTSDTNLFGRAATAGFTLDTDLTAALLGACNQAFGTEPVDLFISALLESFARVFPDRDLPPVYCEGHGRECAWDSDVDLSSTVGWFTVIHPLRVQLAARGDGGGSGIADAVRRTKDARVRISANAWPYFASRFLTKEGHAASEHYNPIEILFNYVGGHQRLEQSDALLVPVAWADLPLPPPPPSSDTHGRSSSSSSSAIAITSDVGDQCRKMALFDITVQVGDGGKAAFTFTFSQQLTPDSEAKVHLWISEYRQSLLEAAELLPAMSPETTLSDFPLMSLTYEDLERVKSDIAPALGISGPHDIADMYPCAPTQKGILISQARSTGTYAESFIYAVSSRGPEQIDVERLSSAWTRVVARHAALRTVIVEDPFATEEGYFQVVLRRWQPRIRCLEHTDDATALEEMRSMPVAATAAHNGDGTEPAHSILFSRNASRVYMRFDISHALIDGASMPIILRDIATAYKEGALLGPEDHRNPPATYRDYIAYTSTLRMGESIEYWMNYLDAVPPCHIPILREGGATKLPADAQSNAVDVQLLPIKLGASPESVLDVCQDLGVTPANLFQVAWAIVLHAYTGMDRVCFGYLTSGRDAPVDGIEGVVGVVCNMLVFKMHLNGDKTGADLLQEAQDSWTNSLQHQFVSLADIQHRRQGHSGHAEALFNTGVSFGRDDKIDDDPEPSRSSSIVFDPLGGHEDSEYAATVSIRSAAGNSGFYGSLAYKTSHMTPAQAKSVIHTFRKAVERIVGMSTRRLNEWCLFTEDDMGHFPGLTASDASHTAAVRTSNNGPAADACIDELISACARSHPDKPAVCAWDGQLTYRELDDLAARVANHLIIDYGVGPEVIVPVCMEKSVWFVVSVLGILKAGGTFAPMDANQPARFQSVVEQTGAKLVITSAALSEPMSRFDGVTTLTVDEHVVQQLPMDLAPPHTPQRRRRDPANAAYVIFTSGSTGTPKGVVIEHGAWCSSASGQIQAHDINEHTRRLQFASYGFDASVGDILATLMGGGCLCIPSQTELLNNMEAAIREMQVNMLCVTAPLLSVLNRENIPSVRTVVVVGESATEQELRKWCGNVRVVLAYGPTECSVESSAVVCRSVDDTKPSNIGFPTRCRYWVVSEANSDILVPDGAIGELLIEGPTLARGYLGDTSRTAAAFITNPAWTVRRGDGIRRMYKTGDLVQRNPDGSYRYLGRTDRQVKIRGQRVELGEVEQHVSAVLGGKYQVVADVVEAEVGSSSSGSSAKLVAFAAVGHKYHTVGPTSQDPRRLVSDFNDKYRFRATLATAAPSYMVPSVVIPLQDIPLLPSHKVDREQLRQIALNVLAGKAGPALSSRLPPAKTTVDHVVNNSGLTAVQLRMRDLWAKILDKDAESITMEESFLEQGGDSILAIKLASACRSAGLVGVSVADILRHQDLPTLCQRFETPEHEKQQANVSPSRANTPMSSLGRLNTPQFVENVICPQVGNDAANIEDIVEATAQQSSFVAAGAVRGRSGASYFTFHLAGGIDETRLKAACQALVAKHPILRTSFVAYKRRVFQVVLRSMAPEFRALRCTESQQEQSAAKLAEADEANPIRLGQPVLQFVFLGGESRSTLVMRISHGQYDGMSVLILTGDLAALYQGQPVHDRPTFADFVYATRERNDQGAEEYWRTLLAGSAMTNLVSHESPRYSRLRERRKVSRKITTPGPQRRASAQFTFATILKAAWALVLAEVASSPDVVFGHVISGRNLSVEGVNGDEILGPCLNVIPVRVQLQYPGLPRGGPQTANDILRQVHDQQLAAIPFETFGMDKIVERCTDWLTWTHFSSVVQYQDLAGVEKRLRDFALGDTRCRLTVFERHDDPADILVVATPGSPDDGAHTDIALYFGGGDNLDGEEVLSCDFVNHLLDRLVVRIEMLSSAAKRDEQLLPDITSSLPPYISTLVRGPVSSRAAKMDHNTAAAKVAGFRFEAMPGPVRDMVVQAWQHILEPVGEEDQGVRARDEPATAVTRWYDLWGSAIAALQFADFYASRGVPLSVEDVMEHPTMLAQSVLLAERMHLVPLRPPPPSLLSLILPIRSPWWVY